MEMANLGAGVDTNIAITNNLSKTQAGSLNSKANTVKSGFSKFLAVKSSETNVKDIAIEDCINQLKNILANLKAKIPTKDTNGKIVVKDSMDKASTDDLISLLSSLINQLNTKLESNALTTKSQGSELTPKVDVTSKTKSISDLFTELNTKLSKQEQSLNVSKLLEDTDLPVDGSKIATQSNLPTTLISSADIKKSISNSNTDTSLSVIKNVKEISNVIEKVLSSVKSEGTNTVLKGNDITKLEGILKNLTQVVDTAEKQVTIKNTTVDMQTLVKSQLLLSGSSNNDTTKQNKDLGYSKSNTDVDKILQKIANQDGSDKTQSFSNLVNRVSNQNDIATTKVADSLLISKDSLTNDVIKTVKFMNVNDIKDLTVKIAPKDLGEVVIKLTQEGNVMKATITTSNKEAYQLINSNLQEINDKISSNNTSIQSFSVDVFNGERSFFKQGSQQNNESGKGKNSKVDSIEEDDGIETISNNDNNLNILV